ncbi:hypothetical protein BVC80_9101g21 [Macleaya cordata]|uniref:Uncharacterized protein n=1 Tax=Macleaya cordata TaxID=56857 RepID=A0A200QG93_MACCD|nr:hypothetical protein BVC80_9101g21 [Macleaya cordata]
MTVTKPNFFLYKTISEIRETYNIPANIHIKYCERFPVIPPKGSTCITLGQLEAGCLLPIFQPNKPLQYEVLITLNRSPGQMNGNFFRIISEFEKKNAEIREGNPNNIQGKSSNATLDDTCGTYNANDILEFYTRVPTGDPYMNHVFSLRKKPHLSSPIPDVVNRADKDWNHYPLLVSGDWIYNPEFPPPKSIVDLGKWRIGKSDVEDNLVEYLEVVPAKFPAVSTEKWYQDYHPKVKTASKILTKSRKKVPKSVALRSPSRRSKRKSARFFSSEEDELPVLQVLKRSRTNSEAQIPSRQTSPIPTSPLQSFPLQESSQEELYGKSESSSKNPLLNLKTSKIDGSSKHETEVMEKNNEKERGVAAETSINEHDNVEETSNFLEDGDEELNSAFAFEFSSDLKSVLKSAVAAKQNIAAVLRESQVSIHAGNAQTPLSAEKISQNDLALVLYDFKRIVSEKKYVKEKEALKSGSEERSHDDAKFVEHNAKRKNVASMEEEEESNSGNGNISLEARPEIASEDGPSEFSHHAKGVADKEGVLKSSLKNIALHYLASSEDLDDSESSQELIEEMVAGFFQVFCSSMKLEKRNKKLESGSGSKKTELENCYRAKLSENEAQIKDLKSALQAMNEELKEHREHERVLSEEKEQVVRELQEARGIYEKEKETAKNELERLADLESQYIDRIEVLEVELKDEKRKVQEKMEEKASLIEQHWEELEEREQKVKSEVLKEVNKKFQKKVEDTLTNLVNEGRIIYVDGDRENNGRI